jgi:hypothetical protein
VVISAISQKISVSDVSDASQKRSGAMGRRIVNRAVRIVVRAGLKLRVNFPSRPQTDADNELSRVGVADPL